MNSSRVDHCERLQSDQLLPVENDAFTLRPLSSGSGMTWPSTQVGASSLDKEAVSSLMIELLWLRDLPVYSLPAQILRACAP